MPPDYTVILYLGIMMFFSCLMHNVCPISGAPQEHVTWTGDELRWLRKEFRNNIKEGLMPTKNDICCALDEEGAPNRTYEKVRYRLQHEINSKKKNQKKLK